MANCTTQPSRQRTFVHLVNYASAKTATLHDLRVRVILPDDRKASKMTLQAPGTAETQSIDFSNDASRTSFTVPTLQTYALITIQW